MLENLNLQKIVLITAIVTFIFAVMVIYYNSLQESKAIRMPRVTTKCPDYWDLSSDGKLCVNTSGMNKGTLNYSTCSTDVYPCCKDGTCYIGINNIKQGDRKSWASTNKFVWDGIYNG